MQSNLARQGKVDVRKDEDQNVKLSQTIRLLLDAGYFRARIKGLSPFDKIVGGMVWCIEVCNYDIDVDLLFHDSLTIGQKISLTERIVKVLPSMKCPHRIEPHQIQGLDAIHIFPVIQWLVNQAIETRTEYHDDTRIIALDEFNRHYSYCIPQPNKKEMSKILRRLRNIKMNYGPKKRFKRKEDGAEVIEENARVMMTLLEYSESKETPQLDAESDCESIEEEDEELKEKLYEEMSLDETTNLRLSSHAVSAIVTSQVEDITSAAKEYLQLKKHEVTSPICELVKTVEHQLREVKNEVSLMTETLNTKIEKEEEMKKELKEVRKKIELIHEESDQLKKKSFTQDNTKLMELAALIEANEAAKKKISTYKEKCREEAENIKKSISETKSRLNDQEESVDESLITLYTSEKKQFSKFRHQIAKKTREIEILKRLIDDVPGRAELSQYQCRFIELYNLVGAEHHETLQFYNMYNSLADSKSYMEKESDLLNSILDNMDHGLASSSTLEEYIRQLEGIIEGIRQNKLKLERKKCEAKSQRSSLSAELNRLQELQLLYARMLHQFSQEIEKNEILLESLEQH